jgi:hypothetical protein
MLIRKGNYLYASTGTALDSPRNDTGTSTAVTATAVEILFPVSGTSSLSAAVPHFTHRSFLLLRKAIFLSKIYGCIKHYKKISY